MRATSVIVVCVLVAVGSAIDFSDMVQGHKEELGDGHYRVTHTLHNTFVDPDTGRKTHVHLDAVADIAHKWEFVAIHEYAGTTGLVCNGQTLTHTNITVTVADEKKKVGLVSAARHPFAVVHSKHLRCSYSAVFGHVDRVSSNGLAVTIHMTNAKFEHVLRNANLQFRTNHVRSKHFPPKEAGVTARRGMEAQWGLLKIFSHAADDIKHFYHHTVHDVEHAADDVEHVADNMYNKAKRDVTKVLNIAEGHFSADDTWPLITFSTGSAALMSNPVLQTPDYGETHQTYTRFDIEVVFNMVVSDYTLQSMTVAVEGDADLAAAWATGTQGFNSRSIDLGTIGIDSIDFVLGVVPVHIQPSIPLHLNLYYDVNGEMKFGATARGHIEYGIRYANGYFSMIKEHSFSFNKHHSEPRHYTTSVELKLVPKFVIDVDFLGGPSTTLTIGANANVITQDDTSYIQCNANLGASIEARLVLRVVGYTIFGPQVIGPHTLASQFYNLGQTVIANPPWQNQGRSFQALEASQDSKIPVVGTTWTLDVPPKGARKASQFVTFQLYDIDVKIGALYLMGAFSYNALNPWSKAPMYATITAPFMMTRSEHNDGEWDLTPFNRSETFVSVTDASLQTDTPSFTVMLLDGMFVLKNQVQGERLVNIGEMLVMTSKATTTKLGSMSPPNPAPSDDTSKATIAYSVAAATVLIAAVALVAAFVARRRRAQQQAVAGSDAHVPFVPAASSYAPPTASP